MYRKRGGQCNNVNRRERRVKRNVLLGTCSIVFSNLVCVGGGYLLIFNDQLVLDDLNISDDHDHFISEFINHLRT